MIDFRIVYYQEAVVDVLADTQLYRWILCGLSLCVQIVALTPLPRLPNIISTDSST